MDGVEVVGDLRHLDQHGRTLASVEGDLAVGLAERAAADPHEPAHGAQLVEVARMKAGDTVGKDHGLELLPRHRHAFELCEGFFESARADLCSTDAVPLREEARESRRFDRGDLAAQLGEGVPLDLAQHVGVAPFLARVVGPELAPQDLVGVLEDDEGLEGALERDAVALGQGGGGERRVGLGEALDQREPGVGHGLQEHPRHAHGDVAADRVAIERGVFDCDVALFARDPQGHDATCFGQRFEPRGAVFGAAQLCLFEGQVADAPEHVVQGVGVPRSVVGLDRLEFGFDLLDDGGVEKLAEFLLPEELAE